MTVKTQQRRGLSPEAKAKLAGVVRDLRARLIQAMDDALQSTYRLSVNDPAEADLDERARRRRQRLEAWLDEQVRGACRGAKETDAQARQRHVLSLVKLAAATFLNRLVVLRQMEALGLVRVKVLTGGWESSGYREFRAFAPALLDDETEGYAELLRLAFDERAVDLPGLFGDLGPTALVPVPGPTLRLAVEALDDPLLAEAWTDDTTLGWVYQFWNDPDREALDEKIRNRGKIENHEIAAKTQLFTDRYMVEWLLQNSLGQLWFAMCSKNGWTAEVVANGTLDRLEARRLTWRAKRDAGEVDLEAMMPLESDEEDRWKYWVPRELPPDSSEHAPKSLKEMKLLDPACGSGHFLVIAFDLLFALYEEEARHRGEHWTPTQIAHWIVEDNLHGIDLDPRAVQIAAAALWLKARTRVRDVRPRRLNLVASNLGLGAMPKDDPALLELLRAVEEETGIPARLTATIVEAFKGADYLGSLLKVDGAVEAAVESWEREQRKRGDIPGQGDLFRGAVEVGGNGRAGMRQNVVERIEEFLKHHTGADELGLRFRGEQLAAGVRFVRMLRERQYHVVLANPPYQNRGKLAESSVYDKSSPECRVDLFAAFMMRVAELALLGGYAGTVTLSNWRFLGVFEALRKLLLSTQVLELLCDLGKAAFSSGSMLISASINLFRVGGRGGEGEAIAIQPMHPTQANVDPRQIVRNRAALQGGYVRYSFHTSHFQVVAGWPLIYWWDEAFLRQYSRSTKIGDASPARFGLTTGNNSRFCRVWWEAAKPRCTRATSSSRLTSNLPCKWAPIVLGAAGTNWFEGLRDVIKWFSNGMEVKIKSEHQYGTVSKQIRNMDVYFKPGVAFTMIGNSFGGRIHRFLSVIGDMGSSIYPQDLSKSLCLLNSSRAQEVMSSLNPGVHFQVGDVNRLPLFPIESADEIVARLDESFTEHEAHRETSVEFKRPGPSSWTWAQGWAQQAVDRETGAPLPPWEPVHVAEPPIDHLSFALGVAMGRFGAHGEGILDEAPSDALPHGILFLANADGIDDGLTHAATAPLRRFWETHGKTVAPKGTMRDYLRLKFFAEDHLARYEKRPIYFPLSSEKRSFVAWVSIHRWRDDTLQVLLADHLHPALTRLAGELADLTEARLTGARSDQVKAQARFTEVQNLHDELRRFVTLVEDIAEHGAPPSGKAKRDADARFHMDLDDGVMINAAALWPLLKPQWKDPEKWWVELCDPKGKKDYDWAHLAARYFPNRVDDKCKTDPSLAVAHGCFWKYHPEKAYQWELRLQSPDELGPASGGDPTPNPLSSAGGGFRLDEPGSDLYRADFERTHPARVTDLRAAEEKRRQRKAEQPAAEEDVASEGDDEEE